MELPLWVYIVGGIVLLIILWSIFGKKKGPEMHKGPVMPQKKK